MALGVVIQWDYRGLGRGGGGGLRDMQISVKTLQQSLGLSFAEWTPPSPRPSWLLVDVLALFCFLSIEPGSGKNENRLKGSRLPPSSFSFGHLGLPTRFTTICLRAPPKTKMTYNPLTTLFGKIFFGGGLKQTVV